IFRRFGPFCVRTVWAIGRERANKHKRRWGQQDRYGGQSLAGNRDSFGRRWRDHLKRAKRLFGVLQKSRGHGRRFGGWLAAFGRLGRVRQGWLPDHCRPQERDHHYVGWQEYCAQKYRSGAKELRFGGPS